MRPLPLVLLSLLLGCAHQANRPPQAEPPAQPADERGEVAVAEAPPAAPVEVGDSVDEVREQLGPEAVEQLLSPSERAISVLYGDVCGGDHLQPSARTRAGSQCGTAKVLKVTLRDDKVVAVEWFEK